MAKNYADLPIVWEHVARASEFVGRSAAHHFGASRCHAIIRHESRLLESPLELLFFIWWNAVIRHYDYFPVNRIRMEPQREVTTRTGTHYRLDFVAELPIEEFQWPKIAVELDGHTFHERTPSQVALRDRRDRDLQQDGWRVFHYSWSEFTQDPERCVMDVYEILADIALTEYQRLEQHQAVNA